MVGACTGVFAHVGRSRQVSSLAANKNIQPRTRTPCPNKDTLLKRQPRSNKNIQPRTRTPCPNKDTLLKRQPRSNEDIPPKPGHPAQTRTSCRNKDTTLKPGHPARTRTSSPNEDTRPNEAVWKIFVKFAGITGLRK